jgi:NAD(P)-dependent dehydrogenase (short-subunit alcohol dehydrogenase family)
MKKIALVTGTSTGLGISVAIQLAEKGFKVYATMRNLDKRSVIQEAAKNAGVSLEIKRLDVQDTTSIEQCVAEIIQQEGRIDILVNNAGAGFVRTTEQATEEEVQWVMDVNFMGVVRCTKAVIPHMREAKSGHIINISSVGGLVGQPFNEIYCAAKFAVEGYTESMASYIQPSFNINFTVVEPGGISSEFANSALQQFQSTGGMKGDEYQPILEKYIGGAQNRSEGVYQTSVQVAEVVIQCIEDPSPPIRIRTSTWSEKFCSLKTQADPTGKLLQESVIRTFL